MKESLDAQYWSDRYHEGRTGWDIGYAAPQLMAFAVDFPKDARILIPGCGRAYEAEALHRQGYTEVYVVDWSREPLDDFLERVPDFPSEHLIQSDFFALTGHYDLMLEQTFFCALSPDLRDRYVAKVHTLLSEGGVLAGLLFDFPLTDDGPPFGGSADEYRARFSHCFNLERMARSELSIPPRAGRELAIRFVKI